MSLPDHLLEPYDEDGECLECGEPSRNSVSLCWRCKADYLDLYADELVGERRLRRGDL